MGIERRGLRKIENGETGAMSMNNVATSTWVERGYNSEVEFVNTLRRLIRKMLIADFTITEMKNILKINDYLILKCLISND